MNILNGWYCRKSTYTCDHKIFDHCCPSRVSFLQGFQSLTEFITMGNMKDAILSSPCNNITHIYIKGYWSWWRRICRWLIILKWVYINYSMLTLQSLPLLGKITSGLFRPKNNLHQELLLYNLLLMLFTLWENDEYNTLNANLYCQSCSWIPRAPAAYLEGLLHLQWDPRSQSDLTWQGQGQGHAEQYARTRALQTWVPTVRCVVLSHNGVLCEAPQVWSSGWNLPWFLQTIRY